MQRIYRGYPITLHTQTLGRLAEGESAAPAGWAGEEGRPEEGGWQERRGEARQPRPWAEPYMFYRGFVPETLVDGPQALRMELDYFKSLNPLSARAGQILVEETSDRMDYPGSPIYDEFPDRVALFGIRDQIIRRARESGAEMDADMIQLLLLNEIGRRRLLKRGL